MVGFFTGPVFFLSGCPPVPWPYNVYAAWPFLLCSLQSMINDAIALQDMNHLTIRRPVDQRRMHRREPPTTTIEIISWRGATTATNSNKNHSNIKLNGIANAYYTYPVQHTLGPVSLHLNITLTHTHEICSLLCVLFSLCLTRAKYDARNIWSCLSHTKCI